MLGSILHLRQVLGVILVLAAGSCCWGQVDPRGPAGNDDFAVLKSSQLNVVIGNNRSKEFQGRQHRAGYNGVFAITSTEQQGSDSPFVPAYAGLNLEHYFDGRIRTETEEFFEPRFFTMDVRKLDDQSVELYQPRTPVFDVESWTRFTVVEPNGIDFSYRCRPHRDHYEGDFLGVFWASYINGPIDKSIYFLDGQATLEQPVWRQFCAQTHNRDSTVKRRGDTTELTFADSNALFANVSPLEYSVPFFYGRFRNMVLIYMFCENSGLRFTHSPSGGGIAAVGTDTNPAWDFQLIVPKPVPGHEYKLEGRLVYKPWQGREDVLAEVARYKHM